MKPVIALLVLGVGSAAAATTVVMTPQQTFDLQEKEGRPGPDSARVASFLATLAGVEPVVCEMLSDQIGNFWYSEDGIGIGRFGDTRPAARAGKDSLSGPVRDRRAIALLAATLGTDDPCVRLVAAKMLGNSDATDDAIAAALGSSTPRIREAALRAAGEHDRPAMRQRVERMLGDDDVGVASMAAWTIGEFEQVASVPALRRVLSHASPRVRASAAWALGQIEDVSAAEDLERLVLRDADRRVRLVAIRALGDVESNGSAGTLERVLDADDIELSIAAAEALGSLDLDEGTAPAALIRATESTNADLKYAALNTLVGYEDPAIVPVLIRFLRDPSADVRRQVIESLGELHAVEAVPALKRALEDPDPEVRRAAVEALAEIDDQ